MPQQTFTIGRSPDCDVVLADESVSRRHAELLVMETGELFLIDCGSTHGTSLSHRGETRRINQEFVHPEATVLFGELSLPVRDLLDAIRAKHPQAAIGPKPAGDPPKRKGRTWARGSALVRCRCGLVKTRGQRCQECGE